MALIGLIILAIACGNLWGGWGMILWLGIFLMMCED